MKSYDAIIIGAGVAGLAAARALGGRRVLVLEARDRIGGRIHTVHDPSFPLPVELGAEFVDVPGQGWETLRAAGAVAVASRGGMWEVRAGVARPLEMDETFERTLGRLDPDGADDRPFRQWLDDQRGLDDRERAWACRFVEGFHAADVDRVGTAWLARAGEMNSGGGGEVRHTALGGYDELPRALHAALGADCEVRLGAVATRIAWRPGRVEVHCGAEAVTAARVVVTVPLPLLPRIRFDPPLPQVEAAGRALAMGNVCKVVFRFREPFWEEVAGLDDEHEHKLLMADGAFPTWWTTSPVLAPMLTAWAGGGAADRVLAAGDPVGTALDSLAAMLDVPRARIDDQVEACRWHDWAADPHARGAYSYGLVGAIEARRALAQPVEGTIWIAGEAVADDGMNGTVEGAIASVRAIG